LTALIAELLVYTESVPRIVNVTMPGLAPRELTDGDRWEPGRRWIPQIEQVKRGFAAAPRDLHRDTLTTSIVAAAGAANP
jgi:hypothetical protein